MHLWMLWTCFWATAVLSDENSAGSGGHFKTGSNMDNILPLEEKGSNPASKMESILSLMGQNSTNGSSMDGLSSLEKNAKFGSNNYSTLSSGSNKGSIVSSLVKNSKVGSNMDSNLSSLVKSLKVENNMNSNLSSLEKNFNSGSDMNSILKNVNSFLPSLGKNSKVENSKYSNLSSLEKNSNFGSSMENILSSLGNDSSFGSNMDNIPSSLGKNSKFGSNMGSIPSSLGNNSKIGSNLDNIPSPLGKNSNFGSNLGNIPSPLRKNSKFGSNLHNIPSSLGKNFNIGSVSEIIFPPLIYVSKHPPSSYKNIMKITKERKKENIKYVMLKSLNDLAIKGREDTVEHTLFPTTQHKKTANAHDSINGEEHLLWKREKIKPLKQILDYFYKPCKLHKVNPFFCSLLNSMLLKSFININGIYSRPEILMGRTNKDSKYSLVTGNFNLPNTIHIPYRSNNYLPYSLISVDGNQKDVFSMVGPHMLQMQQRFPVVLERIGDTSERNKREKRDTSLSDSEFEAKAGTSLPKQWKMSSIYMPLRSKMTPSNVAMEHPAEEETHLLHSLPLADHYKIHLLQSLPQTTQQMLRPQNSGATVDKGLDESFWPNHDRILEADLKALINRPYFERKFIHGSIPLIYHQTTPYSKLISHSGKVPTKDEQSKNRISNEFPSLDDVFSKGTFDSIKLAGVDHGDFEAPLHKFLFEKKSDYGTIPQINIHSTPTVNQPAKIRISNRVFPFLDNQLLSKIKHDGIKLADMDNGESKAAISKFSLERKSDHTETPNTHFWISPSGNIFTESELVQSRTSNRELPSLDSNLFSKNEFDDIAEVDFMDNISSTSKVLSEDEMLSDVLDDDSDKLIVEHLFESSSEEDEIPDRHSHPHISELYPENKFEDSLNEDLWLDSSELPSESKFDSGVMVRNLEPHLDDKIENRNSLTEIIPENQYKSNGTNRNIWSLLTEPLSKDIMGTLKIKFRSQFSVVPSEQKYKVARIVDSGSNLVKQPSAYVNIGREIPNKNPLLPFSNLPSKPEQQGDVIHADTLSLLHRLPSEHKYKGNEVQNGDFLPYFMKVPAEHKYKGANMQHAKLWPQFADMPLENKSKVEDFWSHFNKLSTEYKHNNHEYPAYIASDKRELFEGKAKGASIKHLWKYLDYLPRPLKYKGNKKQESQFKKVPSKFNIQENIWTYTRELPEHKYKNGGSPDERIWKYLDKLPHPHKYKGDEKQGLQFTNVPSKSIGQTAKASIWVYMRALPENKQKFDATFVAKF